MSNVEIIDEGLPTLIGARVLIEPIASDEVTAGGIIIPDTAKEKPERGNVVSVGPKCSQVEQGAVALFGKYAGQVISVDGKEYLIMNEDDILLLE